MTHAIRFHKTGGPEVLVWEEVAVGKPGPGGVPGPDGGPAARPWIGEPQLWQNRAPGLRGVPQSLQNFEEAAGVGSGGMVSSGERRVWEKCSSQVRSVTGSLPWVCSTAERGR